LDIILSNMSDRPIYEQIYNQIKNAIISGELKEGDMLPSIRALAKDLRISVITTKRAYDELERTDTFTLLREKAVMLRKRIWSLFERNT